MSSAIQVRELKKNYGSHIVLKGLDFQIEKGEIFALLGINGAGKTTVLECIEGLRPYDSGTITVNGKMGIQLQSSSLPAHIRPMEAVKLFAKWNSAAIDYAMLNALGIKEMEKKQYTQLSTGQKRRLHLALALISSPNIIFLDEPTAGLDVEGRLSPHKQIRKLKPQGKTIILASHDMAEVETLCDRIAILNNGNIAFCGTASELTDTVGKKYFIHIKTQQGDITFETDNIEDTLIQSMIVMSVSMGAFTGLPPSLIETYGSAVKKVYKANGVPLYLGLVTMFLSAFVHLMITCSIILLLAPVLFEAVLPIHLSFFFLALAIYIIVSLSIGSILGLIVKNQAKLTMTAQLVFLPSIMLSGIMFPSDLLPDFLETIGRIFPAFWGYRLMLDHGFCFENLWYLILVFFAAAIVCLFLSRQKQ